MSIRMFLVQAGEFRSYQEALAQFRLLIAAFIPSLNFQQAN